MKAFCRENQVRRWRRQLVLALLGSSMFASLAHAELLPQQVQNLENEFAQLEGEMRRIEALWVGPVDLTSGANLDTRLSQGELYFVLNMHEQASLVLYGAVSPPSAGGPLDTSLVSHPGYLDGVYQLAESLRALGNLAGARVYFEQLLRTSGHSYQSLALSALFEIASKRKDFDQIDSYLSAYRAQVGDKLPHEIRYIYGKSLLRAGRPEAAVDELQAVPEGTSYFLRAQYLIGAAHVRMAGERQGDRYTEAQVSQIDEALRFFSRVIDSPPVAQEDARVAELAHLARGRLYYELDRLDESIDAYQHISYDSSLLKTMLYEATWTYVRRGQLALRAEDMTPAEREARALEEYELALRQLDDLRILEEGTERASEVELLAGNLRIQRREYEVAESMFSEVRERFEPIDAQFAAWMESSTRRAEILDEILRMDMENLSIDSTLPPVVVERARTDANVKDSIRVFQEMQLRREELAATEQMIQKLEALVQSENRAERFPQLKVMLSRALSLENGILALRARVADLQAEEASKGAPDLLERLGRLTEERRAIQAKVASLPTTNEAMAERQSGFTEGFQRLDQQLHEKSIELDGLRAQLNALDHLLAQNQIGATTAPQAIENTKRKVRELRAVIDELEDQEQAIKAEIEQVRLTTTLSGGKGAAEGGLRDRLEQVLDEESALLSQLGGPLVARLRSLDEKATSLREQDQAFLQKLRQAVDAHVASIQRVIDTERQNLAVYTQALASIDGQASGLRERATSEAFAHIRADFHEVVVRSDVGLIDVAFARKQEQTEKIGYLLKAKTRELTELNQAYADLTRDEP